MSELTIENVLDEIIQINNDGNDMTLRQYFMRISAQVWDYADGFSGKRPFGNSGWEDSDVCEPIAQRYGLDPHDVFTLVLDALRAEG